LSHPEEMTPLKFRAIQTALVGDWIAAIKLNKKLLKNDPSDIETLNRLAFAFAVLGKASEAKSAYKKVLRIDTLNEIAQKGLRRLNGGLSYKNASSPAKTNYIANIFLEETGKTKVIELINVGDKRTIGRLRTAEELILCIKRLKIFTLNTQNQYIGMLPQDLGKRLIKFLKSGNEYEAHVKSVENNRVTVFIRETKRVSRFINQPSFIPVEKTHLLFDKKLTPLSSQTSDE